ncbi:MAG: Uma2 family endonuclease, partial [Leptolyngbyaceae cyanobacterium SM1_1_3]|nr:Uma2 family endonuclease [Leptolyngbyaceae cyanobacterium SM1_1_3]
TQPLSKLLHCIEQGAELAWLLDPEAESILAIFPEARVKLYHGTEPLPVLPELDLRLSASDIFDWLSL